MPFDKTHAIVIQLLFSRCNMYVRTCVKDKEQELISGIHLSFIRKYVNLHICFVLNTSYIHLEIE